MLQTIKEYLKNPYVKDSFYILIVLILVIFIFSKKSTEHSVYPQPIFIKSDIKKDKNNTTYSEVKGVVYTASEMNRIIDSISKALKVKPGNIKSVIVTTTDIDTAIKSNNLEVDTANHLVCDSVSSKDYFISYQGDYKKGVGTFHLKLTPDTATYLETLEKGFFKPERYTVKIYHTNKLFQPQEGYSYTRTVPKAIVCIGPFVGLTYSSKIEPVIGVGATLNLFSIKTKK